jgi:hypothetical protein
MLPAMRALLAATALLLACSPGDGLASSFSAANDPPASTPAESSESSSSSSSTSSSSTSSSSSSSDATTDPGTGTSSTGDTPPQPDFGPPGPVGCQGKIDFLFVIADTTLMAPYQDELIASFPAFYQTIADQFPDFDAHILVTSAGYGWGAVLCEDCKWCSNCTCEAGGPDYPCGQGPKLTECDGPWGSGVVFPAGLGATNHPCELGGGNRYISAATPDPTAAFECVARLGVADGADSAPIDAMFAALGDGMNSPFGCNAGFLRDDALLVVTLIDTYGDLWSDGWPFTWNWTLTDKKGGDPDAFVLLAIQHDYYLQGGFCEPYTDNAQYRLHEFADEVEHGVKGSTCAPNYAPYFAEAAAIAIEQCELLVPG